MRRLASAVVATLALTVLAGCASTARGPTLPKADFSPTLVLAVHGCAALPSVAATAPPCDQGLSVQPAANPVGGSPVRTTPYASVMQVKNLASGVRRVTGVIKNTPLFDTGQLAPGNSTTVVLNTAGTITITDTSTGQHTSLTVRAKPTAKT